MYAEENENNIHICRTRKKWMSFVIFQYKYALLLFFFLPRGITILCWNVCLPPGIINFCIEGRCSTVDNFALIIYLGK